MPTYVCPTCGNEVTAERREDAPDRPFCSKRCRLIDLHHWFNGRYKISDPLSADFEAPADEPADAPVTREDPDAA